MIKFLTINFIIIIFFINSVVYAAESSPSSSIQAKLEELKTSIASKAAKLKQEINKKLDNKFFAGTIQTKSINSLTLLVKNETKNIVTNEDTIFPKKTLDKDMYIAALGEIDDQGFLHAKKIVLLSPTNLKLKTYIWGRIISEEDNLIIIETKDKKKAPVSATKITAKYKIKDTVIITGYRGNDSIIEASFLFPLQ